MSNLAYLKLSGVLLLAQLVFYLDPIFSIMCSGSSSPGVCGG
jgi:hypothetical protein